MLFFLIHERGGKTYNNGWFQLDSFSYWNESTCAWGKNNKIRREHVFFNDNFYLFQEPTLDNLQQIAHALAKRALDNGHDPKFNSPFAKNAKKALGINIIGMYWFVLLFRTQTFAYERTVVERMTCKENICLVPIIFIYSFLFLGGKPDDVTVLLAIVTSKCWWMYGKC